MTDAIQLLIRERDAPKEFLKARIAVQRVEGAARVPIVAGAALR
jgi:hypothetical protein